MGTNQEIADRLRAFIEKAAARAEAETP
jgi:hypothetical protein